MLSLHDNRDIQQSAIDLDSTTGLLTISRARPVNLTELFDYAHVTFHAEPDSDVRPRARAPMRNDVQAAEFNDSLSGSAGYELHMGVNYNQDTGRAENLRVPLTTDFGEAYCENCYAFVTVGIEYMLVWQGDNAVDLPSLFSSVCSLSIRSDFHRFSSRRTSTSATSGFRSSITSG